MTTTEILKQELNNDLTMVKVWRERQHDAKTPKEEEYCKGAVMRSLYRVESKEDLISALGYTVLYNDERDEVIAVYSMELDD